MMNLRRKWAAFAAMICLLGCSESTEANTCSVQEDCDPGFECVDGICVPMDVDTDSDAADASDTHDDGEREGGDAAAYSDMDAEDTVNADPETDVEMKTELPDTDSRDMDEEEEIHGCVHPAVVENCSDDGWCTIPAGCFMMGSPLDETYRRRDEDQHQVTLTYDFKIQATEVTQDQFEALLGYNPSGFKACGGDCPAEYLSWHEALLYCNALSVEEGIEECFDCTGTAPDVECDLKPRYAKPQDCPGYRLPTEAEWEYAIRAGTLTSFYSGDILEPEGRWPDFNLDLIGWYFANADVSYTPCEDLSWKEDGPTCAGTHPVGLKQANGWGLYDMSGNVWEWIWDRYGDYGGDATDPAGPAARPDRVIRGGSYFG